MVEPNVLPRAQHTLTRRDIDPDALKVLYRLHHAHYVAYLVGGSVRDLLLGRRPKDFDIGTDAHPYQVKKLFRNCWVIGRRFRLAHVKFGNKTIEVATFRRGIVPGTEAEPATTAVASPPRVAREAEPDADGNIAPDTDAGGWPESTRAVHEHVLHRDNTFGTPEEDAFRRDFTINALFYDIATFSIIDYVGGLQDLERRLIRCIGDPDVRFLEDPVRMLRAIVLGARLGFDVDPPTLEAIARHRTTIARSAPARLMEEYYKILRSGSAARAFDDLGRSGLLEHLSPEIGCPMDERLCRSLEALDRYRHRFESTPETLTNPILLGSLLVPLGSSIPRARRRASDASDREARAPLPMLGVLPIARRDVERLDHILGLQRRLLEGDLSTRAAIGLTRRSSFREALTWLEIHGEAPDAVARWQELLAAVPPPEGADGVEFGDRGGSPFRRRRRRRRRGPRTLA